MRVSGADFGGGGSEKTRPDTPTPTRTPQSPQTPPKPPNHPPTNTNLELGGPDEVDRHRARAEEAPRHVLDPGGQRGREEERLDRRGVDALPGEDLLHVLDEACVEGGWV